jgi:hypothetical protein
MMMSRRLITLRARCGFVAVLTGALALGCSEPKRDPLRIDGTRLKIENQTEEDWTNVKVVVNRYFHGAAPRLAAGGRMDVQLNSLVSGYGQRFDMGRMPIKDLRVTANRPNGEPIEVVKDFRSGGLEDVFGGKR